MFVQVSNVVRDMILQLFLEVSSNIFEFVIQIDTLNIDNLDNLSSLAQLQLFRRDICLLWFIAATAAYAKTIERKGNAL